MKTSASVYDNSAVILRPEMQRWLCVAGGSTDLDVDLVVLAATVALLSQPYTPTDLIRPMEGDTRRLPTAELVSLQLVVEVEMTGESGEGGG